MLTADAPQCWSQKNYCGIFVLGLCKSLFPASIPMQHHATGARPSYGSLREVVVRVVAVWKWHGWYAPRRGVGTVVADLSNSLAAKGLLRHSSVRTTERHCIKDAPESMLQAMKLLETLCNPRATDREAKPI